MEKDEETMTKLFHEYLTFIPMSVGIMGLFAFSTDRSAMFAILCSPVLAFFIHMCYNCFIVMKMMKVSQLDN